jgi:hypothetical protein
MVFPWGPAPPTWLSALPIGGDIDFSRQLQRLRMSAVPPLQTQNRINMEV